MKDPNYIQEQFDKEGSKRKKSNKHVDYTKWTSVSVRTNLIVTWVSKEYKKIIASKIHITKGKKK